MKVSVSPRRISRRVVKSVGILFVLALVVLAYVATPLTAFADNRFGDSLQIGDKLYTCPLGYKLNTHNSNANPATLYCTNGHGSILAPTVIWVG